MTDSNTSNKNNNNNSNEKRAWIFALGSYLMAFTEPLTFLRSIFDKIRYLIQGGDKSADSDHIVERNETETAEPMDHTKCQGAPRDHSTLKSVAGSPLVITGLHSRVIFKGYGNPNLKDIETKDIGEASRMFVVSDTKIASPS